jgi:glycosyltransferase involved in cell wall biosynthesis
MLTGGRFDVAHSPHPLLLPARHAAHVITIHDLHFLDRPDRTQAEVRRDYPALVRNHAHRADCIITPSRYTAREVERRLAVAPERIVVCPHGAPGWTARPEAPKEGYLLFMGTLEPRKNVGGLLDAYERLPNAPELVLAGHATDDASAWLDRIGRPPLAGRVRYIGYVKPEDRYALYAGARVVVLPSFDEGFGLPILEAMQVGVPVVASNRGALPEVLGDAGPLVDPTDPDALAHALERLLHEPDFADTCIERGIHRSMEFSWKTTAERVRHAYEQALEQRERRGR